MIIGFGSYPVTASTILTVTEETILTPSDSLTDDDFGGAVAIDGNTAIVGAPEQEVGGETNQGAAYIYVRDNGGIWTEQDKLLGSDSDALDHFGTSVDIEGDTAVVGGGIGNVAYVFVRTGTQWNEQAKLTTSGVGSVDNYGNSIAISGDTVIVGAYRDNAAGGSNGPGSAFVFVRNGTNWSLQDTLVANDGENGDEFGRSVALEGDRAVIGASGDDEMGKQNAGAAYVFLRTGTTWNQEAKLEVADITAFDQMGYAVSLNGETALIGARSGNGVIASSGVAYVFTRNGTTWAQQETLFPQNENPSDVGGSRFGHSVALFGNRALIGAPRTDLPGISVDGGAAYVFERVGTTWSQKKKFTASNAATFGEFGGSVSLDQDAGLVGASEQFSTFFGLNAGYPLKFLVSKDAELADVNGDGRADFVWRNVNNGATHVWQMTANATRGPVTFPGGLPPNWHIQAVADVNGDGRADVVWRNMNNGATHVWQMTANGTRGPVTFPGGLPPNWHIQAVADVNGDGRADVVWRNLTNGATHVWQMTANGTRGPVTFPGGLPLNWVIQDVADVNGDGRADVVWRNTNNGATHVWQMTANATRGPVTFPGGLPTNWHIQAMADVNGDGRADVVWRNTNNGATHVWQMTANGLRGPVTFPGGLPTNWVIQDVADVNGDGRADVVWRNTNNGATHVWQMTAGALRGPVTFPGGLPLNWEVQP